MEQWLKAIFNTWKNRHPEFDDFRHEADLKCAGCKRLGTLVSFVTANTECVDGQEYCGHYCLVCGFDGATSRDCE